MGLAVPARVARSIPAPGLPEESQPYLLKAFKARRVVEVGSDGADSTMWYDFIRKFVTQSPGWVVGAWLVLVTAVFLLAPDLTRLAAEGQAHLIDDRSESALGAKVVRDAWPDQTYESQVVVALVRESGLTPGDYDFARRLADRFASAPNRPSNMLRVVGPGSDPAIADRLISPDKTTQLVMVPLSTSFVAPSAESAVAWLQKLASDPGLTLPAGLTAHWTGDAVIGRDYMRNVQTSLDRAAMATVVLLLGVLLAVYRSLRLALVPLITIGISLIISRGILAWLTTLGWEISPLVELFLIVLLFGSGTDFCLFVSWRYAEHWDPKNTAGAMRVTLRRAARALLTSAGTVFVGLMLMGTTRFKLFSSTGPSVALGLVVTLAATLTLTPALLVLLARWTPKSFAGITRPSSGFWDRFAHRILRRPTLSWAAGLILMLPFAALGTQTTFTNDTLLEMPSDTPSANGLRLVAKKFGDGAVTPLTVVIESKDDLRKSSGLAWLDQVSRMLSRQKYLSEVRSATQPLGSTTPLDPARLSNRLAAVNDGFTKIEAGSVQLRNGLAQGLEKLKAARWLQDATGLRFGANSGAPPSPPGGSTRPNGEVLSQDLIRAGSLVSNPLGFLAGRAAGPTHPSTPTPSPAPPKVEADPMIEQLGQAVSGAGQIADGVKRASGELTTILDDPVGRRALDHLLITPKTVRDNPDLKRSFDTYITADGKAARLDLIQRSRMFSAESMDDVSTVRRKLLDRVEEEDRPEGVKTYVAGPNAESFDIRTMTRADQTLSWIVVPLGVFVVLMIALRDPLACVNLVATMLLTYLFALGATHFMFITILGSPGLDWKVPYFLFVLLVAVGVDYNVFLMARLHEETGTLGLRAGIGRAVAQTGGLISSAAAITAISFASLLFSPLSSLRELGFALVVGITVDATLVRPLLVPCGQWLLNRRSESDRVNHVAGPHRDAVTQVIH